MKILPHGASSRPGVYLCDAETKEIDRAFSLYSLFLGSADRLGNDEREAFCLGRQQLAVCFLSKSQNEIATCVTHPPPLFSRHPRPDCPRRRNNDEEIVGGLPVPGLYYASKPAHARRKRLNPTFC